MKKEKASREKGSTDSSADDDDDGDQDEKRKLQPQPQDKRTPVLDAASSQRNQGKKTKKILYMYTYVKVDLGFLCFFFQKTTKKHPKN